MGIALVELSNGRVTAARMEGDQEITGFAAIFLLYINFVAQLA
jgi:hypothetical protein